MSYSFQYPLSAAQAPADARATFIRLTYGHLAGAILAFIGVEYFLLNLPGIEQVVLGMRQSMLLIFLAFIGVSWLANYWAQSSQSRPLQYAGLGLYVLLEAALFLPILYIATHWYKDAIQTAGILTAMVFGGLTLAVFTTRKDFTYLGPILSVGSMLALGFMLAGMLFGFNLGLVFSFAMVALASGYIIYQTSNVLHNYQTDQYVAAALALFASVMLLFFYILRIVMSRRD